MKKNTEHLIAQTSITFYQQWLKSKATFRDAVKKHLGSKATESDAQHHIMLAQAGLIDAAKKRKKHGQARLLGFPKEKLLEPELGDVPSLDEFQMDYDPDQHFSNQEIRDVYEQFYPNVLGAEKNERKTKQRARLHQKRLELIAELAPLIASEPKSDDSVRLWFEESLAKRLESQNLYTLHNLIDYMNHYGYRFFRHIPRVGPVAGEKIRQFIINNEVSIGVPLSAYAVKPRSQLTADDLAAVPAMHHADSTVDYAPLAQEDGTARPIYSVTFGGVAVDPTKDGRHGSNRAPCDKNRLHANTDAQAVQEWLSLQQDNWLTYRSYMKEAQRLHAWALRVLGIALSDITSAHLAQYRTFLRDPQPRADWVADKSYERFHPAWRPFVVRYETQASLTEPGKLQRVPVYGLSERSIKQAFTILKRMFNWLTAQRYLETNPMNGVSPDRRATDVQVDRHLKQRQIRYLLEFARTLPNDDPETARIQFVLHLAYTTGLRLHELVKVTLGDIVDPGFSNEYESARQLKVVGKGGVTRHIPLPRSLLSAIGTYLATRGLNQAMLHDPAYAAIPLIGRLHDDPANPQLRFTPLSTSVLYRSLKRFFAQAAASVPPERVRELSPATLAKASTHWLRHSHGSHLLANGASLTTVQANLGHKSLQTTSLYLHSEDITRQKEIEQFDQQFFGAEAGAPTSDGVSYE